MKSLARLVVLVALVLGSFSGAVVAADPVPLDCEPGKTCQPIDPCQLAPERCQTPTPPPKPNPPPTPEPKPDPCQWCVCTSGTTPHPACRACCP